MIEAIIFFGSVLGFRISDRLMNTDSETLDIIGVCLGTLSLIAISASVISLIWG